MSKRELTCWDCCHEWHILVAHHCGSLDNLSIFNQTILQSTQDELKFTSQCSWCVYLHVFVESGYYWQCIYYVKSEIRFHPEIQSWNSYFFQWDFFQFAVFAVTGSFIVFITPLSILTYLLAFEPISQHVVWKRGGETHHAPPVPRSW